MWKGQERAIVVLASGVDTSPNTPSRIQTHEAAFARVDVPTILLHRFWAGPFSEITTDTNGCEWANMARKNYLQAENQP